MQGEEQTPIKQDIKKGKLREYPYNINWNYGMLPRTWENPEVKHEELGGIAVSTDTNHAERERKREGKEGGREEERRGKGYIFYEIKHDLQTTLMSRGGSLLLQSES